MTFTASDVLLKAASRIEEEGMWCQKEFYKLTNTEAGQLMLDGDPDEDTLFQWARGLVRIGRRVSECAQGALLSASIELGDSDLYEKATKQLNLFIGREDLGYGTIDYNDAPGRTADEVAEAMRQAASR